MLLAGIAVPQNMKTTPTSTTPTISAPFPPAALNVSTLRPTVPMPSNMPAVTALHLSADAAVSPQRQNFRFAGPSEKEVDLALEGMPAKRRCNRRTLHDQHPAIGCHPSALPLLPGALSLRRSACRQSLEHLDPNLLWGDYRWRNFRRHFRL